MHCFKKPDQWYDWLRNMLCNLSAKNLPKQVVSKCICNVSIFGRYFYNLHPRSQDICKRLSVEDGPWKRTRISIVNQINFRNRKVGNAWTCEPKHKDWASIDKARLSLNFQVCWSENLFTFMYLLFFQWFKLKYMLQLVLKSLLRCYDFKPVPW